MSAEVRSFFIKLIAYLAHFSLQDDPILIPAITSSNIYIYTYIYKFQCIILLLIKTKNYDYNF